MAPDSSSWEPAPILTFPGPGWKGRAQGFVGEGKRRRKYNFRVTWKGGRGERLWRPRRAPQEMQACLEGGAWAGRGRALERRPLCVVSYRRVPAACALTRAFRGCRNLGPQEERTEARREDAFLVFPLSQRSARLALPEPGGPGDAPVEQGGLANRRPRSPVPGSLTRRLLCSRGPWVRVAGLGVRRRPRKGLHNKYF